MYGVWLMAALATATADAYSTEPICVGLTTEDVDAFAGERVFFFGCGPAGRAGIGGYSETDCLGGVKEWHITIGPDDLVSHCAVHYHPFAACPLWLAPLRDALFPRQATPAGDS